MRSWSLYLIHRVRIHPNYNPDRNKLWSTQTLSLRWSWGGRRNIRNRKPDCQLKSTLCRILHNLQTLISKQGKQNCNIWQQNWNKNSFLFWVLLQRLKNFPTWPNPKSYVGKELSQIQQKLHQHRWTCWIY